MDDRGVALFQDPPMYFVSQSLILFVKSFLFLSTHVFGGAILVMKSRENPMLYLTLAAKLGWSKVLAGEEQTPTKT